MYSEISQYLQELKSPLENLPVERQSTLDQVATFAQSQLARGSRAKLTFICTHNSRRSQLAQVWAATAAAYYGLAQLESYSGGTEATAFDQRALAALQRAGFRAEKGEGGDPAWLISFDANTPALACFSKTYDHPSNPRDHFAAIMTCSQAQENCPIIPGAAQRVPLPYDDPKDADDTPREKTAYDHSCRLIAAEMVYTMRRIKEGQV